MQQHGLRDCTKSGHVTRQWREGGSCECAPSVLRQCLTLLALSAVATWNVAAQCQWIYHIQMDLL